LKIEDAMSGFAALHLTEPAAAALARHGYAEQDPYLAEVVPTAARGNNLVVVTPPAALHAVPGLAGAISAFSRQGAGLLLVLVPEPALAEWETVIGAMARTTGHRSHAVRTLARAGRLLQSGGVDILIAPPEAALALTQRSALKADQVAGVFMAWPELWADDESITPLMQDIGRDVPRTIYTTEQERVASLVERHARRALTVAPMTAEMPPALDSSPPPRASSAVRLVSVSWSQRERALREVIELLDPSSSSAWTVSGDADFIPSLPPGTTLAVRVIPPAGLIVACDIPTAAQLSQLAAAGEVVILVPPTAQAWIRRVLPQARVLRLADASDAASQATQARRQQIAGLIEGRSTEGALLALAPLFERYDPATVAAALYDLWQERPAQQAAPSAPSAAAADVMNAATARIWVGVGRKDGATANDFVGVLTKELKYERSRIGKIEVRELYSLVEVPAVEAEALAGRLSGVTIRRRRVTARIDRGGKVRSEK
jgi:ATP-dependent RNA helicase DeaD